MTGRGSPSASPHPLQDHDRTPRTLTAHLGELRNRLIISIAYLLLGFGAGMYLTDRFVFKWLLLPMSKVPEVELQVLGPAEKILAYFKIALIAGCVLASPFILHQLWLFLRPGLNRKERRFVLAVVPISVALFITGALFVFYVLLPFSLLYLIQLQPGGVDIENRITLDRYFSFVLPFILAGGLLFQIPLFSWFLARIGLLSSAFMTRHRKVAILVVVILAAIITPTGDPFNLFLLAVPMYALYEASILVAKAAYRSRSASDSTLPVQ